MENTDAIITAESGKPITEAKREVLYGSSPHTRMITRKAGDALVAGNNQISLTLSFFLNKTSLMLLGCTLVVKPSSFTPLTCLIVTRLAEEAGFCQGGENMCNSHDIQIISFTGSTRIGQIVYGLCSKTMKRISLELGGNAPLIVFDSADLKNAVENALAAKFRNCGQACIAANRIFDKREYISNS
uniref:Succinate-semialdehyde dehydrogenase, mitochondrial n=1 Tax=Glossina austeni TaxID=7395 RepID=A0A1A9VU48_GLOAU